MSFSCSGRCLVCFAHKNEEDKEEGEGGGDGEGGGGQGQLGRKLLSCCHCQELCQHASWLLIGYTRVSNQVIKSQVSKLTQLLTMTTTHKFPPQDGVEPPAKVPNQPEDGVAAIELSAPGPEQVSCRVSKLCIFYIFKT